MKNLLKNDGFALFTTFLQRKYLISSFKSVVPLGQKCTFTAKTMSENGKVKFCTLDSFGNNHFKYGFQI